MEETVSTQATRAAGSAVASDLKAVIRDIEVLLKSATASGGELAANVREQLEVALLKLQARVIEVEKLAAERAVAAARAADNYVHEKPWHAIGAAAGAGLIVGWLLSRR
jgi:ElaB/YqjD/DUF883 family membrane-anchored ribosome-binding protein